MDWLMPIIDYGVIGLLVMMSIVGVANAAPIQTPGMRSAILMEDKPDPTPGQPQLANNRVISPDYFRTLGVPLLKGRFLSTQDNTQAPPVAIINQALARRYWGEADPIGKRFKLGARASNTPASATQRSLRISAAQAGPSLPAKQSASGAR